MSRFVKAPLIRGALSFFVFATWATGGHASPISNTAVFTSTSSAAYSLAGTSGALPTGMSPVWSTRVNSVITYGTDADGSYVQFDLSNPTARTKDLRIDRANSGAYQAQFGSAIALSGAQTLYRFTTKVKVLPAVAGEMVSPEVDIWASYFFNGDKSVPNVVEAIADNHLTKTQILQNDVVAGASLPDSGAAITSALPAFLVQNLLPQERVLVRIYVASMNRYGINANLIHAMDGVQTVRPGSVAKFTTRLSNTGATAGLSGSYLADFQLVSLFGAVTHLGTRSVSLSKPATAAALNEVVLPYQGALPTRLNNGTYSVQVRLRPAGQNKGVRLSRANTSVSETSTVAGGYAYRIGTMKVSKTNGGIYIGATAVRYPYSHDGTTPVNAEERLGTVWGPKQLGLNAIRSNNGPHWSTTSLGGSTLAFDPSTYTRAFNWLDGSFHTELLPRLTLADWAKYYHTTTGSAKNLLINTWGVAYEASSDPTNIDNGFFQGGLAAPVSTNARAAYQGYLSKLFSTYGDRLFGIECGNEPNSRWFWSGTQTQLADSCKAIYDARKAANRTSIPILCPQADSPERMSYVLSARTSGNQPITAYCDWFGAHVYSGMGSDQTGKPYSTFSLAEKIRLMQARMTTWGVGGKPLIVTEYGVGRANYNNQPYVGRPALDALTDAQKADAVYQSIATMQEAGATGVMLYALDSGENFLWTLDANNSNQFNATVMQRILDAKQQLGATRTPW